MSKLKMMNDFSCHNLLESDSYDQKCNEYATNYSFGKYLNDWECEYSNSVIAVYKTLKDELIKNKYSKLLKDDYYSSYEDYAILMKKRGYKMRTRDVGINNKKFNIPWIKRLL